MKLFKILFVRSAHNHVLKSPWHWRQVNPIQYGEFQLPSSQINCMPYTLRTQFRRKPTQTSCWIDSRIHYGGLLTAYINFLQYHQRLFHSTGICMSCSWTIYHFFKLNLTNSRDFELLKFRCLNACIISAFIIFILLNTLAGIPSQMIH